jgi:hypothetical protein
MLDSLDDSDTNEALELRIKRCTSCQARIVFLTTSKGNAMPADADTVEADDQDFDPSRHTSHFATCSNPDKHRKNRRGK